METADTGKKRPLIEIGWVIAGRFDSHDLEAARGARSDLQDILTGLFPAFDWRVPFIRRREVETAPRPEPVDLLELGARERDAHRLDFTVVLVESDLRTYFKPFTLGVPSKAMNVAVLSTARIDPGPEEGHDRISILRRRIVALGLHLFGHLNDLGHVDEAEDYMFDLRTVTDLDGMTRFAEEAQDALFEGLNEEADVRLEEAAAWRDRVGLFYVRVVWKLGLDIAQTVVRSRPWLFPLRLSKLTTAALSALLILMTTAEAWELGMTQPPQFVTGLSVAVLLSTVLYVVKRQRLLLRPHERRLSEQHVISNVSTILSVTIGMATTYVLLFGGTFVLSQTVYPDHLVASWAPSIQGAVRVQHYLVLSAFVAALGLTIGALGASFEATDYFRHITYVDEET